MLGFGIKHTRDKNGKLVTRITLPLPPQRYRWYVLGICTAGTIALVRGLMAYYPYKAPVPETTYSLFFHLYFLALPILVVFYWQGSTLRRLVALTAGASIVYFFVMFGIKTEFPYFAFSEYATAGWYFWQTILVYQGVVFVIQFMVLLGCYYGLGHSIDWGEDGIDQNKTAHTTGADGEGASKE